MLLFLNISIPVEVRYCFNSIFNRLIFLNMVNFALEVQNLGRFLKLWLAFLNFLLMLWKVKCFLTNLFFIFFKGLFFI